MPGNTAIFSSLFFISCLIHLLTYLFVLSFSFAIIFLFPSCVAKCFPSWKFEVTFKLKRVFFKDHAPYFLQNWVRATLKPKSVWRTFVTNNRVYFHDITNSACKSVSKSVFRTDSTTKYSRQVSLFFISRLFLSSQWRNW